MVLRNQTSQSSRVRVEPFPASITFWLFSWNSKLKIKCLDRSNQNQVQAFESVVNQFLLDHNKELVFG